MIKDLIEEQKKEFVEKGASLEHERWAKWQKYMHSKILPSADDGISLIGTEFVDRWNRQIATHYDDLSEEEKESDREQVRPYLPLLTQAMTKAYEAGRESVLAELQEEQKKFTQGFAYRAPDQPLNFERE